MDYSTALSKYTSNWNRVEDLRGQSFFGRHIFSLPYQWAKRYYARHSLNILAGTPVFPMLEISGDSRIVVSLTSFPERIEGLHLVIKSLFLQEMLPGRIALWLAQEEFPAGMEEIPQSLLELQEYGLEIAFVPHNYHSHNKYYYAFGKYRDKLIITVDDDMIYPRNTLSRLVRLHKMFPHAVCANRVQLITRERGRVRTSDEWVDFEPESDVKRTDLVARGYGSVLYPAGNYRTTACEPALFGDLSPLDDDLWLKAVELSAGVEVAAAGSFYASPPEVPGTRKITLKRHCGDNGGDDPWQRLEDHFDLDKRLA